MHPAKPRGRLRNIQDPVLKFDSNGRDTKPGICNQSHSTANVGSFIYPFRNGYWLRKVNSLPEERSLDELPDEVFVALGRRGMEGIPLKECTYCNGGNLSLLEVKSEPERIAGKRTETVMETWRVRCNECSREFSISCRIRYHDGARYDTMVNIIDDAGKDLGWLGSY